MYTDRITQVIEAYVARFPFGIIYLDGAGSPKIGRHIIDNGREKLQEERGDNQYIDITSTKPGKRANYLLNRPSPPFVNALELKLIQRYLETGLEVALGGINLFPEFDDLYRKVGKGIEEPRLHNLPQSLGKGKFIPKNDDTSQVPNKPYESQTRLEYASADQSGVYVVENSATEQIEK